MSPETAPVTVLSSTPVVAPALAPECDCTTELEAIARELEIADDLPPEVVGIAPAILVVLAWYLWKRKKKPPPPPPAPTG